MVDGLDGVGGRVGGEKIEERRGARRLRGGEEGRNSGEDGMGAW